MKHNRKLPFRSGDLIAVAVLLAAAGALALAFGRAEGATAEVLCGKEVVYTVNLSDVRQSEEITLENGVTVTVSPGSICFSHSDCANQLCVRAGRLTKAGQSAACIPNRTLIRVKGRAKRELDALTG